MPEQAPMEIDPIETPRQLGLGESFLLEVSDHIWVYQARDAFEVTGKGLTAAVLDTGLNMSHLDFAGRIVTTRNFTDDYGGDPDKADDGNGHGTQFLRLLPVHRKLVTVQQPGPDQRGHHRQPDAEP